MIAKKQRFTSKLPPQVIFSPFVYTVLLSWSGPREINQCNFKSQGCKIRKTENTTAVLGLITKELVKCWNCVLFSNRRRPLWLSSLWLWVFSCSQVCFSAVIILNVTPHCNAAKISLVGVFYCHRVCVKLKLSWLLKHCNFRHTTAVVALHTILSVFLHCLCFSCGFNAPSPLLWSTGNGKLHQQHGHPAGQKDKLAEKRLVRHSRNCWRVRCNI